MRLNESPYYVLLLFFFIMTNFSFMHVWTMTFLHNFLYDFLILNAFLFLIAQTFILKVCIEYLSSVRQEINSQKFLTSRNWHSTEKKTINDNIINKSYKMLVEGKKEDWDSWSSGQYAILNMIIRISFIWKVTFAQNLKDIGIKCMDIWNRHI